MMKNHKQRLFLFLAALLAASLACNYPGRNNTLATPTAPVPVSSEAVEELGGAIQTALAEAASSGKVELTITESQLTSLAALELRALKEPQVENVQIRLQSGQVLTTARVTLNGLPLDLRLTSGVMIGVDGLPKTYTTSAQLGPLPIPESMLQLFTQSLDSMLADLMVYQGQRIHVEKLDIGNGVMQVSGVLK